MAHKRRIKYRKERVLVADVLPYELPTTFTNYYFYRFLSKYNKDQLNKNKSNYRPQIKGEIPSLIKKLLFEIKDEITVPYKFDIRHDKDHPRALSIIHPYNQIQVSEFYDTYKSLLLYYGNFSEFSLRKIDKISTFENFDDSITDKKIGEPDAQEESSKEYVSTSSFFTYKRFSIMYRFFEDNLFFNAEKRFNKMLYLDISKCFDSVYTHSLAWSLLGKDEVKKALGNHKDSFSDSFDVLMQRMNYNETNGIVIGPEFSRIFAEILLQGVDRVVEEKLKNETLRHKNDYRIFRYIDDYFVFYNTDKDIKTIEKVLFDELAVYKFFINESKKEYFNKPIITNQTIAKNEIENVIQHEIQFNIREDENVLKVDKKLSPNKIKSLINSIVQRNAIRHSDVMNLLASRIEKKIKSIDSFLDKYQGVLDEKFKQKYERFIWDLLDVLFFFFSVKPRVSLTIRLSHILMQILKTLEKIDDSAVKNTLYKKMYDEIYFVLKKYKDREDRISMIEALYLLLNLKQLGPGYQVDKDLLLSIIDLYEDRVDYLFITTMIFYIKDNPLQYKQVKERIKEIMKIVFERNPDISVYKDTEKVLLMFDLLRLDSFLSDTEKVTILKYFVPNIERAEQDEIVRFIENNNLQFTHWENYNQAHELNRKRYKNVY